MKLRLATAVVGASLVVFGLVAVVSAEARQTVEVEQAQAEARQQLNLPQASDPGRAVTSPTSTYSPEMQRIRSHHWSWQPLLPAAAETVVEEPVPEPPALLNLDGFPQGTPLGTIEIPAIGVDWVFLLGVTRSTLNQGPGLTPWYEPPGGTGAAVIAGHRTTYGAPFNRIDELVEGDLIRLTVEDESFDYAVFAQQVVYPNEWKDTIEALRGEERTLLVLSACTPKGSAKQRLLVFAELIEDGGEA